MKELRTFTPEQFSQNERSKLMLLVCDETAISCVSMRKLQEVVAAYGAGAVLVMPDYQYQRGLRGWAKAQILASIVDKLEGVMPVGYEAAKKEQGNNWALVRINGPVTWSKSEVITPKQTEKTIPKIVETKDPIDRVFIDKAKKVRESSNCWLDPGGCVFVKDGEVLIESCSTSFNQSKCRQIPIDFRELPLNRGERMFFCDSLHAERVGISKAAQRGISLQDSTIYLTKFPCRPCAASLIASGVGEIIYEEDSYGLAEVGDLLESNSVTVKKVAN